MMKDLLPLLQGVNAVGLYFPFLLFAMRNWYVPGTLFPFSAWKEGWGGWAVDMPIYLPGPGCQLPRHTVNTRCLQWCQKAAVSALFLESLTENAVGPGSDVALAEASSKARESVSASLCGSLWVSCLQNGFMTWGEIETHKGEFISWSARRWPNFGIHPFGFSSWQRWYMQKSVIWVQR